MSSRIQAYVDLWNAHMPTKTPVIVRMEDGTILRTTTTSKAGTLNEEGDIPCVVVADHDYPVGLDRVMVDVDTVRLGSRSAVLKNIGRPPRRVDVHCPVVIHPSPRDPGPYPCALFDGHRSPHVPLREGEERLAVMHELLKAMEASPDGLAATFSVNGTSVSVRPDTKTEMVLEMRRSIIELESTPPPSYEGLMFSPIADETRSRTCLPRAFRSGGIFSNRDPMDIRIIIEIWNVHVAKGTPVAAWKIDGTYHHGKLASKAKANDAGVPFVMIDGADDLFPLERVVVDVETLIRDSLPPDTELAPGAEIDASAIGGPERYIVPGSPADPRMAPSCSPNDVADRCPRCGIGIDDDGDGDCAICAGLSDAKVTNLKVALLQHGPPAFILEAWQPIVRKPKLYPYQEKAAKQIKDYLAKAMKGATWRTPIIAEPPEEVIVVNGPLTQNLSERLKVEVQRIIDDGSRPFILNTDGNPLAGLPWSFPEIVFLLQAVARSAHDTDPGDSTPNDELVEMLKQLGIKSNGAFKAVPLHASKPEVMVTLSAESEAKVREAMAKGMSVAASVSHKVNRICGAKIDLVIIDELHEHRHPIPGTPDPLRETTVQSVSLIEGTTEELSRMGLSPVFITAKAPPTKKALDLARSGFPSAADAFRGTRSVELRNDDGKFEPFEPGLDGIKKGMVFRLREPNGSLVDKGEPTEVARATEDAANGGVQVVPCLARGRKVPETFCGKCGRRNAISEKYAAETECLRKICEGTEGAEDAEWDCDKATKTRAAQVPWCRAHGRQKPTALPCCDRLSRINPELVCEECGRAKARTADELRSGACTRHWDWSSWSNPEASKKEAEDDCRRSATGENPHGSHCHGGRDGDCTWGGCPQRRENEPKSTGRHCPLDWNDEDDEA